jgi:hypothetical protein
LKKCAKESGHYLLKRGYKLPQAFMEAEEITAELIKANTLRVAKLARTNVWKL